MNPIDETARAVPTGFDPERWAVVLAPAGVAGIVAGIAFANPLGLTLLGIGMLLLLACCISRTDGFLLTGPFVSLELRRSVRKTRLHLWWGLIAGVAAIGILCGYWVVYYDNHSRHRVGVTATLILLLITWHLFLMMGSIVVTLMAYSIAEDRDGKRIDFILASDLRSREIVVGKAIGRLFAGLSHLMVLLPMLILLPALFGIDPGFLLLITAIGGVTLFSLTGLTMLSSSLAATKKSGGTALTMFIAPYMLISFAANALKHYPEIWFFPGDAIDTPSVCLGDVIDFINIGNPILMAQGWAGSLAGGVHLAGILRSLPGYAAFHAGFGLMGLLLATYLLRSKSAGMAEKKTENALDAKPVPPVTERPIEWKERYFTKAVVQTRRKRAWKLVSFVMIVLPMLVFGAAAASDLNGRSKQIAELALIYPPLLVWIFSVAGSRFGLETIVRERDKDTLTSLLLADATPREIITAKLHGILRIMVPSWVAVGAVTAASVACGGLTWWGGCALLVMMIVFSFFFIIIGMHTSAKATSLEAASKAFGWKMAPAAIVPPLCIMAVIVSKSITEEEILILGGLILAILLVLYATAAWLVWKSTVKRFERACDPAAEAGPLLGKADRPNAE